MIDFFFSFCLQTWMKFKTSNSYVPSCQQHLIINAIFLSPLPKNRLCRTHTSPPWPVQGYQVLLDDGNRIIIPQGNFKFYLYMYILAWKGSGFSRGEWSLFQYPSWSVDYNWKHSGSTEKSNSQWEAGIVYNVIISSLRQWTCQFVPEIGIALQ